MKILESLNNELKIFINKTIEEENKKTLFENKEEKDITLILEDIIKRITESAREISKIHGLNYAGVSSGVIKEWIINYLNHFEENYEKLKAKPTPAKTKPQPEPKLEFEFDDGIFGPEVKFETEFMDKEDFEKRIQEKYPDKKIEFKYSKTSVEVLLKPSNKTEIENEEDEEDEDDIL